MRLIYETGDVVKLQKTKLAGYFSDCKVILLHLHEVNKELWKVKVYPDEGFAEEDSIQYVSEKWFIPNLENLKQ